MKNALIGYSGLVGSNLDHNNYSYLINSKNSQLIKNQTFDNIVCCGFSGTKYLANMYPEQDWQNIQSLLSLLSTIKCKKFTLISTIDIYEDHAYGKHRKQIEEILQNHFENFYVIRLPGIYGKNLKKNALYDLTNKHELHKISLKDQYQWYHLEDLDKDLLGDKKVKELFTEPITIEEINNSIFYYEKSLFGNVKSKHYERKPYIYNKETVIQKIKRFVSK